MESDVFNANEVLARGSFGGNGERHLGHSGGREGDGRSTISHRGDFIDLEPDTPTSIPTRHIRPGRRFGHVHVQNARVIKVRGISVHGESDCGPRSDAHRRRRSRFRGCVASDIGATHIRQGIQVLPIVGFPNVLPSACIRSTDDELWPGIVRGDSGSQSSQCNKQ